MSMEQFETAKAQLLAMYGTTSRDAMQKRAQALARLYAVSEWTIPALAEVEGTSTSSMFWHLYYGRFLNFTNGKNVEACTERRFRDLWLQTDKHAPEAARFAAVAALLAEDQGAPKVDARTLGKSIVAQFGDGKWHRLQEIADALASPVPTVRGTLDRMVTQGLYKTHTESRPSAHGMASYRIVKGGNKKINLTAFVTETQPILDEIQQLLDGHAVNFSQATLKPLFFQFRQKIQQLAH